MLTLLATLWLCLGASAAFQCYSGIDVQAKNSLRDQVNVLREISFFFSLHPHFLPAQNLRVGIAKNEMWNHVYF